MLPEKDSEGTYGDDFWERVAQRVKGKTASDCLNCFLDSHLAVVGRFKAATPDALAPARSRSQSLSERSPSLSLLSNSSQ